MIQYLIRYPDKILTLFLEHIQITFITIVISVLIVLLLMELSAKWKQLEAVFITAFSAIYSIPSLALFAILIPFTGLGKTTAIIALVLYNQFILLRNFLTGINDVDAGVREAAKGLGMNAHQILWRVQVPLARKSIFAGIRISLVSTIGIATIASAVNAGGLGDLLFDGLRTMNVYKLLWGSLLSATLALVSNGLLKKIENVTLKADYERGR